VTTINPLAPSHIGTELKTLVDTRTRTKEDLYRAQVELNEEKFLVGVVTDQGHVTAAFRNWIATQAKTIEGVEVKALISRISLSTIASAAQCLLSAERTYRALFAPRTTTAAQPTVTPAPSSMVQKIDLTPTAKATGDATPNHSRPTSPGPQ
jgi:hypothetical protein